MSDLISRREMLRTYQELCMNIACSECSFYFGDVLTGYCSLEKWIHSLPSAEKAQLSEEGTTKDATSNLINRQDAIDALGKEPKFKIKMIKTYAEGRSDQWFKDVATIASLPSVEPTIIRCRDCKHHDGIRCFRWNSTIITGFDDFCSNAEKRGEEDG